VTASAAPLSRTRAVLAALALVAPFVAVAVSRGAWLSSVPDRLPFHWDAAGRVDGTIATAPVADIALAATGAMALAGIVVLCLPWIKPKDKRDTSFWLGSIAGLAAAAWLVPAALTLEAGSASDAELGGWLLAFMLAVFYGAVPFWLLPKQAEARPEPVEPLALAPNESGAWSRTVTTTGLVAVTGALAVLAVSVGALSLTASDSVAVPMIGMLAMLFALGAVASFALVRVTVDWRGLRVVSLLTRVPLLRVPLERVEKTEVVELRASDWGGLGLRSRPGRRALILRSGSGMVVTAADGSQYAVSLDRPETPAGLLAALARAEGAREGD
jgi:hypothetical protein